MGQKMWTVLLLFINIYFSFVFSGKTGEGMLCAAFLSRKTKI